MAYLIVTYKLVNSLKSLQLIPTLIYFDEKTLQYLDLLTRAVIEDAIFASKSIKLNIIEYEKIIFMLIIC